MEQQPLIRFQNLSKTFGRGSKAVDAVLDLDLAIAPGQVYGFLGRNGAGKTTTIRLLLGLIRATQGSALLFGEDVQRNPRILRRVGALVEDPGFYAFMSGRDNLRTLVRTTGEMPDERVDHLLELVGLEVRADQRVSEYSKGMRQRLGIAAALLGNPDLIILDEPTNGLDPKGIQEIRALIRGLVDQHGKTVFLSSHILSEVEQVCDRVAIIHHGRVVREGKVSSLLASAANYLRLKIAPIALATKILEEDWEVVPGSLQADKTLGCLQIHAPANAAPGIVRRLVEAGIDVHQVVEHSQSLEEYFLQATLEEGAHA